MITSKAFYKIHHAIHQLNYDFGRFTIDDFIAYLMEYRQKDILIVPFVFRSASSGAWMPCETADYIFYSAKAHDILRVHIMLHEIGHMLLNHRCLDLAEILPPEVLALQKSSLRLRTIKKEKETDPEELEAEMFVRELRAQIMAADRFEYLVNPTSVKEFTKFVQGLGYDE